MAITGFFFLIALVMGGIALLLWDRIRFGEPARIEQYEQFLDCVPDRFRHLSRIMAPDDAEFLRALPGGEKLAARLERDRRRVLRLTLADLQSEFQSLVAVGAMLASSPTARRDSFGLRLMGKAAVFHSVCILLRLLSYVPFRRLPGLRPSWPIAQLQAVRDSTRFLLNALTNADMDHLRKQILD